MLIDRELETYVEKHVLPHEDVYRDAGGACFRYAKSRSRRVGPGRAIAVFVSLRAWIGTLAGKTAAAYRSRHGRAAGAFLAREHDLG